MEYRELSPSPPLAPYVRCYWSLSDLVPSAQRPLERVVPDGRMELIVHLGDPFERLDASGRGVAQRPAVVAGQLESALLLKPGRVVDVFAVRFHPWGAGALLGLAPSHLLGHLPTLEEVVGARARELEGRLRGAPGPLARREVMEAWLISGFNPARRVPPLVEHAARLARRHAGRLRASELADTLEASPRRLERGFREHVGLAPKAFLRIARLQGVLQRLAEGTPASWASLALEHGFYDQAHLSREFQALAGISPTRYAAEAHGLNDAIVETP